MSKIRWIIFLALTVGLLTVLVIFSKGSDINVSKVDVNAIQTAFSSNGNIAEHVYGNADSSVTLIEYGDFQCSACAYFHPTIKSIVEEYKQQIKYVFRNFPLGTSHPNGRAAAGTAEAAGLQGKYWDMFDKLYESQNDWGSLSGDKRTDFFANYAKEIGISSTKFLSDLESDSVSKKIDYDKAIGLKAGVDATPALFLNGKKLDSDILSISDTTKFKTAIDAELKKAGIALPSN